ncbi:MAG: radical SAM protein [Actinobacteria bacterium HGW-Actinobacteria-1]|nr:MAG: radical SAM protein [Actinobacteria bacterium HGW-Actinobacteria-1]
MNGCVITTFRCNAKCHMCNIWQHQSDAAEELPARYYEKLPDGLGRLNVTGGEPMLRDDIMDIIGIVSKKAKIIEVSTNGFYTDRILEIAHAYPKTMFRVSLEGLPELNDRLRGTKDGFDHALRTMLGLIDSPARDIGFSVVICDKNADDLLVLYKLCVALGVEFGNSVMHNSWYFHKEDNAVKDLEKATAAEKEFIKALLTSQRHGLKMKLKDYLRAYFNLNILNHLDDRPNVMSACCAGRDLFFVDPWGNVTPCNGTREPWTMGNLKDQTFDEIWTSPQADEVRTQVDACQRSCAFIGTARFDMLKHPVRPLSWIARNKLLLAKGAEISYTP